MLGSLTMFACGVLASSPRNARSSLTRWSSLRRSGNCARTRPAREMSRVSTAIPAASAYALTIGSSEYVASAGASSVLVQWIFGRSWVVMLPPRTRARIPAGEPRSAPWGRASDLTRAAAVPAGVRVEAARDAVAEVGDERVPQRRDRHPRLDLLEREEPRLDDEAVGVAGVEEAGVAGLERERHGAVVAPPVLDVDGVGEVVDAEDLEARLLEHLAPEGVERRLPPLDHAPGERVADPSLTLPVVAYEQDAALRVQEDGRGNDELTPGHRAPPARELRSPPPCPPGRGPAPRPGARPSARAGRRPARRRGRSWCTRCGGR